jgi:hypothetical protein
MVSMQNLNRLLQVAQAASFIGDLTRHRHTHTLPALPQTTVYLHTDDAALRVVRWERRHVEATIETRPPMGWRVAADHDENGVYIVAIKRAGFGTLGKALLDVMIPQDAHLVLRMNGGLLSLDHVHGTLSIAPPDPFPTAQGELTASTNAAPPLR